MIVRTVEAAESSLPELLETLEHDDGVAITADGRPVALLVRPDDCDGLLETLEVMANAELVADIERGRADYASGRVVDGLEAARALRPRG